MTQDDRYIVKKVHGFTNEQGEYTGQKRSTWYRTLFVSGFAVMLGNKVIRCYKQKHIAQLEADFYNSQAAEK